MARKTRRSIGWLAGGLTVLSGAPAAGQSMGGVRLSQPNVLQPGFRGRDPQPAPGRVAFPTSVVRTPIVRTRSGGIGFRQGVGDPRLDPRYDPGADPRLGVGFGGSGVSVRVGDADDDFQLRVRLGGGYPFYTRYRTGGVICYPGWPGYGYGWGSYRWIDGYPAYRYHPDFPYPRYAWSYPVEYRTASTGPGVGDPRLGGSSPTEPMELTVLQRARLELARGRTEASIAAYREHLAGSELDAIAMRELAVALLDAGRLPEGVALMRQAYEMDPLLVGEPIERGILGGGKLGRLGRALSSASRYANRVETASAWLTVAALIQAQDRDRVAGVNAERAIEAGISKPIAEELRRHFGLSVASSGR